VIRDRPLGHAELGRDGVQAYALVAQRINLGDLSRDEELLAPVNLQRLAEVALVPRDLVEVGPARVIERIRVLVGRARLGPVEVGEIDFVESIGKGTPLLFYPGREAL
jgi:hypothetical protein